MILRWPTHVSLDGMRSLVAAIAQSWQVEHLSNGRHDWRWTTPAFDAARFQGDGTITWTVEGTDRSLERYARLGDVLIWQLLILTSSTGGSASGQLRVTLPDGLRHVTISAAAGRCRDAGTFVPAVVQTIGPRTVAVLRADGGNWSAAASNNTNIGFSLVLPLME